MPELAGLYVDGFNLYYGLDELRKPHLKWLNLRALGEFIAKENGHILAKTVFCSAYNKRKPYSYERHRKFISALELVGVEVIMGSYSYPTMGCDKCKHTWPMGSEKQTDVNLALSVYRDAHDTQIKHFYLLSADADQGGTAKFLHKRFPDRTLKTIAPPNRELSDAILTYAQSKLRLNEDIIEKCLFDRLVTDGKTGIVRPTEYDPPAGWVPPRARAAARRQDG